MKNKILVTKSSIPSFWRYCREIKNIWKTHWLTNRGEKNNKFEELLSAYLDVPNVTTFVNGHLALEIAICIFNFPKGSEIITTPFTFVSTTSAIVRNGLVPVFCDIEPDNFTIDVNKIEQLITEKTVAILGVHVYGNICDVEKIDLIAKQHNLKVIYDAAHAFGVKYKGKGIANYGDVSMFSFHATKVFNSIEGGCLCYHDSSLSRRLQSLANFGLTGENECSYVAGNAKMNEFQAAMGLCNLKSVDKYISKRKKVVELYNTHLKDVKGIRLLGVQDFVKTNYSYFPVLFDSQVYDRNRIKKLLEDNNILTRKYFYPITSNFDAYKKYNKNNTPIAVAVSNNILALPLYPDLSKRYVNKICKIIKEKYE